MLWLALFAWSALLCVLALTQERWAFAVVLVLTEVAGGSIDTAMNAEASHRLVNHPSMLVRLHALFNTGALAGAAAAALVIHAGRLVALDVAGDRRRGGLAVGAVGRLHRLRVRRWRRPRRWTGRSRDEPSHPLRRLRRDGLVCCCSSSPWPR